MQETTSTTASVSLEEVAEIAQQKLLEKQRKIQTLRTQLYRANKKSDQLKPDSRTKKVQKAIDLVSELFDGSLRDFFVTQLKLSGRAKKGNRYSNDDKAVALSLFHTSPKCYRLLKKLFCLPSISTLKKCMHNVQIFPGFHPLIFEALKQKSEVFDDNEKVCCLIFDEMALKSHLQYNSKSDTIDGFATVNEGSAEKFVANHASVFMIRGLTTNWKQPVGYFLSNGPLKSTLVKKLLLQCIGLVSDIGLKVKVVICDQGSNNRSAINSLGVTVERPFFVVNEQKVFVCYDPPHLLKNVRNNLKKADFSVNNNAVSWRHIKEFYLFDRNMEMRMARKLTDKHIYLPAFSNMNVKLAAQVFSNSVAVGINTLVQCKKLEEQAIYTARFIKQFNNLFDAFNSRSKFHSVEFLRCISKDSSHLPFLKSSLKWIQCIKTKSKSILPCLFGWQISISCVIQLCDELFRQPHFSYLLTSRLNQDCLENFFSVIRGKGGHRDNPSCVEFRAAYRDSCIDAMFVKAKNSNCEGQFDSFLLKLSSFENTRKKSLIFEAVEAPLPPSEHLCEYPVNMSLPQINVTAYVAGYLLRKVKDQGLCSVCLNAWIQNSNDLSKNPKFIFLSGKKYNADSNLFVPTNRFVQFVTNCEATFVQNFDHMRYVEKPRKMISSIILKSDYCQDISCQNVRCLSCKQYVVELFCTVRIAHAIKMQNQNMNVKGSSKNRKLLKLQHV